MKKRFKLLIMVWALLCLSLAIVASADSCKKTLYVDGNQIGNPVTDGNGLRLTWISPHIMIGADGRSCHIGTTPVGSSTNVWNQYSGAMDEFAIYNGILASNRIKSHYNDAVSNNYNQYKSDVQSDSPLLWLKLDDSPMGNWASAYNSGSVAINGIYRQTALPPAYPQGNFTQIAGIASGGSNAVKFPIAPTSGTVGAWIEVDDSGGQFSTNINGKVTIELWVDCNSTDTNNNPLLFQHNGSNSYTLTGGYGLEVNGPNQLGIIGAGQIDYVSLPYDINDSNWHHIVVTYDSNYVPPTVVYKADGTYVGEVNADNPVLWLRFEDATQAKDYSAADGNHWVGYGSAANIVSKVGGIGNSVLLKWPTGSGSGLGGVYGVAATNNPNAPPAVSSSYEVFDNNYAFVPGPNSITFELWVKSLLPLQQMLSQEAASGLYEYAIYFQQIGESNDEPRAPAVSNSDDQIRIFAGNEAIYTGVPSPFDQKWHQLVVAYDVNDPCYGPAPNLHIKLYGDGNLITETTDPNGYLGPELSHIMLGAENDIGNSYNVLDTYMDEFAIYAGVLGPDRVLAHYTAWQPKNCADMQARGYGRIDDRNNDCYLDFRDLASFAADWRKCNDPCDPKCVPNW
jgi:hypothetical protein